MLGIRYSPESIQWVVAWKAWRTSALGRERELERRRLERRGQLGVQPERVECRLRVPLSLPLSFPAHVFVGRVFCKQSFAPPAYHASGPFNARCQLFEVFAVYQLGFPRDLNKKAQGIGYTYCPREEWNLLPRSRICCYPQRLKKVEKQRVYFCSNPESFITRHIAAHRQPQEI